MNHFVFFKKIKSFTLGLEKIIPQSILYNKSKINIKKRIDFYLIYSKI